MIQMRLWLLILFFFSGIPALIYQIIWQRSLFSFYGVNIHSITVIVADFMLGLGLGALLGGAISQYKRARLILIFAFLEIFIGTIAYFSLPFLQWIAFKTLDLPFWQVSILVFGLILLPTVLMGASLPILSEFLVRRYPHVGKNTALLYASNTLGAAFACFLCANFLFKQLGLSNSILLAASINMIIGLGALLLFNKPIKRIESPKTSLEKRAPLLALSLVLGFISLSYEIIWLRVIGFASLSFAPVIINSLC